MARVFVETGDMARPSNSACSTCLHCGCVSHLFGRSFRGPIGNHQLQGGNWNTQTRRYSGSVQAPLDHANRANVVSVDISQPMSGRMTPVWKPQDIYKSKSTLHRLTPILVIESNFNMATNIDPPTQSTLTAWAEEHLTTLYKVTSQADFDTAFDSFISKHAVFNVNGFIVSRGQYKNQLRQEKRGEKDVSLKFVGTVEVPLSSDYPEKTGWNCWVVLRRCSQ